MKIKPRTWIILSLFALLSCILWYKFSYPQFSFVDLSINRNKALEIAEKYLREDRGIDISRYNKAIVFASDRRTNRFLQKTLGFEGEKKFFKEHAYDLFFWAVRFYQENQKEEFHLNISSSTGQIIAFRHTIEDAEARDSPSESIARDRLIEDLKKKFNVNPEFFILKSNQQNQYDNRMDYAFAWSKKNVYIPWSAKSNTGGGKLLTGGTVSGEEIRLFFKNKFEIPDPFTRYIKRLKDAGDNLSLIFHIIYILIITASVFYVLVHHNHLVMHIVKNFFIGLTAIMFLLFILDHINNFQSVLFYYRTTSSLCSIHTPKYFCPT